MVELQEVTVRFGPRLALRELSLNVPAGGSLALWGPNGAGKSTTFNTILNLVPYKGRILIDGRDAAREGASVRRLIGWAPQELAPADLTVARTVTFMADVREAKVPSVAEYLEPFGLTDTVGQTVAALSGGQRKRLSLALALLGDPAVLLLDEPTANLDPEGRHEMIRLLLGLRRQGKTLIMASHRLGDVLRLCDEVAMLADGCLRRLVGAPALVRRRLARRPTGVGRFRAPGRGGQACAGCD
jgi:ABC-type multidrug transport system ATPase subunit